MGINISIGANASEAIREARRAGDAVDSIGDTLDDLARDSARSGREAAQGLDAIPDGVRDAARDVDRQARTIGNNLGDGVQHGVRDSEQSLDHLTASFRDSVRAIQRVDGGGGLGSSIGTSTQHGVDEASEGLDEFRDEASGTAREAAASFDGSADSILGAFQEVAANAFAGFGPAGALAGVAAAAGLGIIVSKVTEIQERQEALKAKTADLGQAMIESGREGGVGYQYAADQLKELATAQDDLGVDLRTLKGLADDANQPFKKLAQAYAGNVDGINETVRALRDQQAELIRTNHSNDESATSYEGANTKKIDSNQKVLDKFTEVQKQTQEAAESQKLYLESGAADLQANATAQQSYADSVVSAYAEAGDAQQGFTDDGVFNLDRYITKTAEAVKTIEDYSSNMATAVGQLGKDGHDEAIRYLESLGPDAAPLVQAFIKAPDAQRGQLASLWDSLGGTASAKFGAGLQQGLDSAPARKGVTVYGDLSQFNRDMAEATRQREVHIKAYTDNVGGTRQGMGVP